MLRWCATIIAALFKFHGHASRLVRPGRGQELPTASSLSQFAEDTNHSVSAATTDCPHRPLCGKDGSLCLIKKYVNVQKVCDEYFVPIRRKYRIISVPEILRDYKVDFANAVAGAGKSGASFQFLGKRYILKTMDQSDMDIFTKIIPDYKEYMVKNVEWTMMVRIYSVLKAEGKYWMLMGNFVPVKFPALYDLKGSFYQRTGEGKNLKDNNWVADKMRINLAPAVRKRVLKAVQNDAKFLGDKELLDYSLIVGHRQFVLPKCGPGSGFSDCRAPVRAGGKGSDVDSAGAVEAGTNETAPGPNWNCIGAYFCGTPEQDSAVTGSLGDGVGHNCVGTLFDEGTQDDYMTLDFYCFGIIDILKLWDTKAHLEYMAKKVITSEASVQPPPFYQKRFVDFLTDSMPDRPELAEFKPDKRSTCPAFPQRCGSAAISVTASTIVGMLALFAVSDWIG